MRGSALSEHWLKGGEGALELAEAVIDACAEKTNFKFLYEDALPLRRTDRADRQGDLRGGRRILYPPGPGEGQAVRSRSGASKSFCTCMVKTHLSLTHDPD